MMSILFILIFSNLTHVPLDRKVPITTSELTRVNAFVDDFDHLVVNAIDQSAYGSLAQFALLQQNIFSVNQSQFFDNFSNSFESCFEGTTYSYSSSVPGSQALPCYSSATGVNFSFDHYVDNLFTLASTTFNVSINYSDVKAQLIPSNNPFDLRLNVSLLVHISRADYSWDRYINVQRDISIDGVDHPLIKGRKIRVSPMIGGRNFGLGDTRFHDTALIANFINGGYYFRDNRSPSFIDLFEGNIPSPGGISTANNLMGITSFLPANESFIPLNDVYVGNYSSSVEYDYLAGNAYNPDDLRRLNYVDINVSQIFPAAYLEYMGFDLNEGVVELVSGHCDNSGCS